MTAEKERAYLLERVPFTAPLGDGEESHLFCCVDGKNFLIERGVEVELPRYVILSLEDAARQKKDAIKQLRLMQGR